MIDVKKIRNPGFEPGSTAWKAAILTTRLITNIYQLIHHSRPYSLSDFTKLSKNIQVCNLSGKLRIVIGLIIYIYTFYDYK